MGKSLVLLLWVEGELIGCLCAAPAEAGSATSSACSEEKDVGMKSFAAARISSEISRESGGSTGGWFEVGVL